jgi:hypothetical protein
MTGLKHLLNEEDTGAIYAEHQFYPEWPPYDPLDEYVYLCLLLAALKHTRSFPTLPDQSWKQYVSELFGSQTLQTDLALPYDDINIQNESLQYANEQIEQWATGNVTRQNVSGEESPPRKAFVCYGTVSVLFPVPHPEALSVYSNHDEV